MTGTHVFLGSWTNHADRPLQGRTLTTTNSSGAFLLVFIALFVTSAGKSLWYVLRYVIHQARTTEDARDAFDHQQQAVLRNTSSASEALQKLLELSWARRSTGCRFISRSLLLILFTGLYLIVWFTAGLFSSRVTLKTATVLIRSPDCGYFHALDPSASPGDANASGHYQAYEDYRAHLLRAGSNYAQSCDASDSQLSTTISCNTYPTNLFQRLSNTTIPNSCPFEDAICLDPAEGSFRLDTGLLDTQRDLGINTLKNDRLSVRKVLECAPIKTEPYTFTSTLNLTNRQEPIVNFTYGSAVPSDGSNVTLRLSTTAKHNPLVAYYTLDFSADVNNAPGNDFTPIPALNRTDADIHMILLVNNAKYLAPISDPLYRTNYNASEPIYFNGGISNLTYYGSNDYASGLGCAAQYQICNGSSPGDPSNCTPLNGLQPTFTNTTYTSLSLTPTQQALANHLFKFVSTTSLEVVLFALDPATLLLAAQSFQSNTLLSQPLPPDQWKREVTHWSSISLAALQQSVVDFAAGPAYVSGWHEFVQRPAPGDPARRFCDAQTVRDTAFSNFSVLGIVVVFVGGGVLILAGLLVEPVVHAWRMRRRRAGEGSGSLLGVDSWVEEDFLHMQRRVFEGKGVKGWTRVEKSVPLMVDGDERFRPFWWEKREGEDEDGGVDFLKGGFGCRRVDVRVDVAEDTAGGLRVSRGRGGAIGNGFTRLGSSERGESNLSGSWV